MKVIVLAKTGTARLTMWPAIDPLVKSVIGMPRPDIANAGALVPVGLRAGRRAETGHPGKG